MDRFRWAVIRRGGRLIAAGMLMLLGCTRTTSVDAQEQPLQPAQARPTTVETAERQRETVFLDSLFEEHNLQALAWHPPDTAQAYRWADSVLATLSLDEKIGQLFIIHLPRLGRQGAVPNEALRAVQTDGVGGFLVSRVLAPRDVWTATRSLQQRAKVPLFFAADYERGAGRFSNALTELPSNMALGATRDTLLAAAAGRLTALESRSLGINLLFAPVVDVNNNPDNPIINIRSYGEDPDLVGRMAGAFVREAERHGVLTTLKHFPGHGNTAVDSHTRMGVVAGTAAALDSLELAPYRHVLSQRGAAAVMSAHLWVPAYDDRRLPATLSRRVLHDVLRDSLGFEGIVVTDDIRMGALRNGYRADERIIQALAAGADVILTPERLPAAIHAVNRAVQRGVIDEAALDRSVQRVLRAKGRVGLQRAPAVGEEALAVLLQKPRGERLARTIAGRAVTLLKTDPSLPLQPARRTMLLQLRNVRESESITAAMDTLAAALDPDDEVRLSIRPSQADIANARQAASRAEVVVLALYLRLQSGRGKAGLYPPQEQLVRRLLDREEPVILITFGNPYAVTPFAEAEALIVAYEQSLASVEAVVALLQGRRTARGLLPITVDPYPYGSGL